MVKTVKGTTKTGFEYEIEEKRLANYELIEALNDLDDNPLVITKVVKMLLGNQTEDLKNHVRDEDGIVDAEKMSAEIVDIFTNQTLKK